MIVTKNKVVSIDYTLTDDEKNVIDRSGQAPLEYLHGFGNIIPGLEKALEGKAPGDRFSVKVPAAEAYGERDKRLIMNIPRENFQDIEDLEPGMQFHTRTPEGVRLFTVVDAGETEVTVDGNHPLAGMNLTFDVAVTAVRDASAEEIKCGDIHTQDHGCADGCECDDCGNGEDCGCGGCGH